MNTLEAFKALELLAFVLVRDFGLTREEAGLEIAGILTEQTDPTSLVAVNFCTYESKMDFSRPVRVKLYGEYQKCVKFIMQERGKNV